MKVVYSNQIFNFLMPVTQTGSLLNVVNPHTICFNYFLHRTLQSMCHSTLFLTEKYRPVCKTTIKSIMYNTTGFFYGIPPQVSYLHTRHCQYIRVHKYPNWHQEPKTHLHVSNFALITHFNSRFKFSARATDIIPSQCVIVHLHHAVPLQMFVTYFL